MRARTDESGGIAVRRPDDYPSTAATSEFVAEAKRRFAVAGIAIPVVSGGGTPNAWHAHEVAGLTEVRVGTYIYHDRATVAAGAASLDECALHLCATVVSRPTEDRAVIDAGTKSLTSDQVAASAGPGYGLVLGYPDAVIERLNEEHGVIDISRCGKKPESGEVDKDRAEPRLRGQQLARRSRSQPQWPSLRYMARGRAGKNPLAHRAPTAAASGTALTVPLDAVHILGGGLDRSARSLSTASMADHVCKKKSDQVKRTAQSIGGTCFATVAHPGPGEVALDQPGAFFGGPGARLIAHKREALMSQGPDLAAVTAKLVGLNHVALEVGNVEEALAFYGRIFSFTLRGRQPQAAFIDLGDQFIALMEGPLRAERGHRHFGLVVADRSAVRTLAAEAGAELLDGPFLDFLDPWGNRIEVVDYSTSSLPRRRMFCGEWGWNCRKATRRNGSWPKKEWPRYAMLSR